MHGFAVFRHRAPGNFDTFGAQQINDLIVRQDFRSGFLVDQ